MEYFIGVDTGGTFTDCVIMDKKGRVSIGKSPSTPHDFSIGVLDSLAVTAKSMGITIESLLENSLLFAHGTTIATNTIINSIINEIYPDIYVTLSSELIPIIGEYERTATTVLNSYIGPRSYKYFLSLKDKLKEKKLKSSPLIMQSYGGSL